ncbi:MAG: N-acetylmuramoyl-L-alanine amidase [Bacteroidia bacterium]|nr:N-acetylmuramoyl-L-alanine amidase [Bacteroidia bacterium]
MSSLNLKNIIQFPFSESEYYKEEAGKKQIVIHHTVSGPKAENIFIGWQQTPERVATALVIGGDGKIVQGYSSKYWAHHLGLKTAINTALNKNSVGIELCNWGGLTFDGTKYRNAYGNVVSANSIVQYKKAFRGFKYFQQYTPLQIESLRQLLVFLCDKYAIPKTYNADMWDISANALAGKSGIYTHVSYRADKSDCHPQPELIAMLKTLAGS